MEAKNCFYFIFNRKLVTVTSWRNTHKNISNITQPVSCFDLVSLKGLRFEPKIVQLEHVLNLFVVLFAPVGNCIQECISNATLRQCACKRYFMPSKH